MLIIILVVMMLLVTNVMVYKYASRPDTKAVKEAVDKERAALDAERQALNEAMTYKLNQKDKEITDLRRKHNRLIDDIRRKAKEADDIKPPQTNKELRERLTGLGYPPR